MVRRCFLAIWFVAFATAGVACAAPVRVVAQATPNPLIGKTRFAVHPLDFRGLVVGDESEPEYLADKDAEAQASWVGDKAAMNTELARKLMEEAAAEGITVVPATGPGDAPFFIRPRVTFIEPGFYAGVASGASHVTLSVQITTSDGVLVDDLFLDHGTGGSIVNAAVGQRLRSDARGLGERLAGYLKTRVRPGD